MPRIHSEISGAIRAQALVPPHASPSPAIDLPRRLNAAPAEFFHGDVIGDRETMKALRILVVEYDLTVGPLVAEMLEDLGHVVCAVELDVENAVAAATHHHPDVMIVDLGFGQAPGAAIKDILRDGVLPCVFVTDVLPDSTSACGAVIVRKPFRAVDIVAAIQLAISGPSHRVPDALSSGRA